MKSFHNSSNFRFTDIPKKLTIKDYMEVRDRYVDAISKDSNVVSIFEFGNISLPGVSDLDLIVVLESKPSRETVKLLQTWKTITPKARYVFVHTPMICSIENFKDVPLVFPLQKLKKLYGRDLEFSSLSSTEKRFRDIGNFLDFSFFSLFSMIEYLVAREIALTRCLRIIGPGLRSLFQTGTNITGNEKWLAYAEQLQYFRENLSVANINKRESWEETVIVMLKSAAEGLFEMVVDVRNFLIKEHIFNKGKPELYSIQQTFNSFLRFSDNFTYDDRKLTIPLLSHLRDYLDYLPPIDTIKFIELPSIYAIQFSLYGTVDNFYGYLHKTIYGVENSRLVLNEEYTDLMKKRVIIAEEIFNFVHPIGFSTFVNLGYYGLETRVGSGGTKNLAIKLIWLVYTRLFRGCFKKRIF